MKLDKSRKLLLIIGLMLFFSGGHLSLDAFADSLDLIQLQTFKNYSRITLQIDGSVSSRWKKSGQGFEILLPSLTLLDLGVPSDERGQLTRQLAKQGDYRVKNLKVRETTQGVKITGEWRFPAGKMTLASPVMDSFDFREKASPRMVVDFWVRPGITLSDDRAHKQKLRLEAALRRMQDEEGLKTNRKLAMEGRRAELKDIDRYCSQPLTEKDDFFLRFYPVHKKLELSKLLPGVTPDENFDYYSPEGKSRESQHIRLAKKLYDGGNFALTIRTLDFFDREFPKSQSMMEMRFLRANALIKLGHNEAGELILNRIVRDYKKSAVALHSSMYLGLKAFERKLTAVALEKFLWLIDNHSEHRLNYLFHLAAAECMFDLYQFERAAKEYKWLMEKAPTREIGAEGAFRLGDIYLRRFQYEKALSFYYQGIQPFEIYGGKFPEYYLNRGETLYQLGEMEKAKVEFLNFLERFPAHPEGWRASFRTAEIIGRDPQGNGPSSPEFREKLFETINRYPFSPGALLARVRLSSCGDHGGLDFQALERFFSKDALEFDGSGSVVMSDYPDFRAITHLRSLITSEDPKKTLELGFDEFKVTRSPLVKRLLRTAIHDAFQKIIVQLLNQGKGYEALSFYTAKSATLPVAAEEVDRDYLLKLSRVASDLEMGKLANEILNEYKKQAILKRGLANATPESKGSVAEQNFALAKALWIKFKNSPTSKTSKSDEDLDQIQKLLASVASDPRNDLERLIILGQIEETENNLSSAIRHVSQACLMQDNVKLEAWLASLYLKAKNTAVALSLFQNLEKKLIQEMAHPQNDDPTLAALGLRSAPDLVQTVLSEAQILEANENWEEAASAYSRLISGGVKSNRILYGYARSLGKSGKDAYRNQIVKTLEDISRTDPKADDEKFWKNLAAETLANEKVHESIQKNAKEGKL